MACSIAEKWFLAFLLLVVVGCGDNSVSAPYSGPLAHVDLLEARAQCLDSMAGTYYRRFDDGSGYSFIIISEKWVNSTVVGDREDQDVSC